MRCYSKAVQSNRVSGILVPTPQILFQWGQLFSASVLFQNRLMLVLFHYFVFIVYS